MTSPLAGKASSIVSITKLVRRITFAVDHFAILVVLQFVRYPASFYADEREGTGLGVGVTFGLLQLNEGNFELEGGLLS